MILISGTGEMNGTLVVKRDVDVFRFTVGEFDYLDLRGLRFDGGEALTVRLFFGDGRYWNFVVDENSQVLAGPRELVGSHFQNLLAGEYFVVVGGGDSQAVDYRISITAYNFPLYELGEVVMVAVDDSGEKIDPPIRPLSQSLENNPAKVPTVGDDLYSVDISHSENQGLAEKRVAVGLDDDTFRTKGNWHNDSSPPDVNADGRKTPLDVLLIIEWLNERGVSSVAASTSVFDSRTGPSNKRPSFLDVSGNGKIEPMDALLAINELNREPDLKQRTEGESAPEFAVNIDWIFSKHADDWGRIVAEAERPLTDRPLHSSHGSRLGRLLAERFENSVSNRNGA